MHYVSTRNPEIRLSAAQAIVQGLSRDGGLFLPEEIPQIPLEEIKALSKLPYPERARRPVPELHDIPAISQVFHRRGLRVVKFTYAIRLFSKAKQLFLGKFFEIQLHDLRRALRVRQLRERLDFF